MVVVAGRFKTFHQPDALGHQTLDTSRALFGRVQQSEVDGVNLEFSANLINQRFHGEGCLGCTRSAVGSRFGFVDDHVVPVHFAVLHVVTGKGADDCLHDW